MQNYDNLTLDSWDRLILLRENGLELNWMDRLGKMMEVLEKRGIQTMMK